MKVKKNSIRTILVFICTAVLALCLAACGGGGNGDGGGDGNKPIGEIDFGKAGISGSFTAQVSGDLKVSRETEEVIELKWEKSNEQSFNNVITWLKDGGYDKYDGADAVKESHPNGSYTMYCSDKDVDGIEYEATSIFFHKDANFSSLTTLSAVNSFGAAPLAYAAPMAQEINFKANDLYVIIEPLDDGELPPPTPITTWPTNQIAGVLGANRLPVYAGTASTFEYSSSTTLGVTTLTVVVNGAAASDEQAYKTLLTTSGYTLESGVYKKSFGSDDVSVIVVGAGDKITVTATFSASLEAAWPASQLNSAFSGSGVTVPSYDGASGFDFSNTFGVVIIKASNAVAGIEAYETKLVNAGFTKISDGHYQKNANNDKVLDINISDVSVLYAGQVWLTITLEDKAVAPELHYTLPQNVKVQISAGGMVTTVIKIGDDYYASMASGGNILSERFLAHNDGTWTEYEKPLGSEWAETGDTYDGVRSVIYELESTRYFGYMTDSYDLSEMASSGQATVAGTTTDIYVLVDYLPGVNISRNIHQSTGLIFKEIYTGAYSMMNWEVIHWQISNVTFDGLNLPV